MLQNDLRREGQNTLWEGLGLWDCKGLYGLFMLKFTAHLTEPSSFHSFLYQPHLPKTAGANPAELKG